MKNSVDLPVCRLGSWDFYDFKGATDLHGENEGGDTGAPGQGITRWNFIGVAASGEGKTRGR